jgi:hypothetical protein
MVKNTIEGALAPFGVRTLIRGLAVLNGKALT